MPGTFHRTGLGTRSGRQSTLFTATAASRPRLRRLGVYSVLDRNRSPDTGENERQDVAGLVTVTAGDRFSDPWFTLRGNRGVSNDAATPTSSFWDSDTGGRSARSPGPEGSGQMCLPASFVHDGREGGGPVRFGGHVVKGAKKGPPVIAQVEMNRGLEGDRVPND